MDRYDNFRGLTLYFDLRYGRMTKPCMKVLPKLLILLEKFGEILALRVPARAPGLNRTNAEPIRVCLLAHVIPSYQR